MPANFQTVGTASYFVHFPRAAAQQRLTQDDLLKCNAYRCLTNLTDR